MKRLLIVLALCTVAMGQAPCPEADYLPLTGWAFAIDPGQIPWDHDVNPADPNEPAPRRRLIHAPFDIAVGQTVTVGGWACDANGDAIIGYASVGEMRVVGDTWTWSWKPLASGIYYVTLAVGDVRDLQDSLLARGGLVVRVKGQNARPTFGCAAP